MMTKQKSTLVLTGLKPEMFEFLERYKANGDTINDFATALLEVARTRAEAGTRLL